MSNSGRRCRSAGALALVLALSTAACGGGDGSSSSAGTAATTPVGPATSAPNTDPAPENSQGTDDPGGHGSVVTTSTRPATTTITITTTTTTTITTTTSLPAEVDATDLRCDQPVWTELAVGSTGQITFVRNGALFAVSPDDGRASCLADLRRTPARLDWGPQGDRLLVDADLVVAADGTHPSGFVPGTAGITWSKPKGTALIAPSPDGAQLRHVKLGDPNEIEDVGGLRTTWMAEYHPSGVAIIAAGIADDGTAGLFITDNHGGNVRPLAVLDEDPADLISDLAVSAAGNVVTFVHDHTPGALAPGEPTAHLHEIVIPGMTLTDLAEFDTLPTELVASRTSDSIAWASHRSAAGDAAEFKYRDTVQFPDASTAPVGFLGDGSAVVIVRPTLTPAGPGNLWVVPPTGSPTLLVEGVDAAATRTAIDSWIDLPSDIEAQAPG